MEKLLLKLSLVSAVVVLCAAPARAEEWTPATGPLMTRWSKDVSPEKPLPEYPRPQLVRKDWINLAGLAVFGHDGKMVTYAAMVVACALTLWWLGFGSKSR